MKLSVAAKVALSMLAIASLSSCKGSGGNEAVVTESGTASIQGADNQKAAGSEDSSDAATREPAQTIAGIGGGITLPPEGSLPPPPLDDQQSADDENGGNSGSVGATPPANSVTTPEPTPPTSSAVTPQPSPTAASGTGGTDATPTPAPEIGGSDIIKVPFNAFLKNDSNEEKLLGDTRVAAHSNMAIVPWGSTTGYDPTIVTGTYASLNVAHNKLVQLAQKNGIGPKKAFVFSFWSDELGADGQYAGSPALFTRNSTKISQTSGGYVGRFPRLIQNGALYHDMVLSLDGLSDACRQAIASGLYNSAGPYHTYITTENYHMYGVTVPLIKPLNKTKSALVLRNLKIVDSATVSTGVIIEYIVSPPPYPVPPGSFGYAVTTPVYGNARYNIVIAEADENTTCNDPLQPYTPDAEQ